MLIGKIDLRPDFDQSGSSSGWAATHVSADRGALVASLNFGVVRV
jgi:hypothetical protein